MYRKTVCDPDQEKIRRESDRERERNVRDDDLGRLDRILREELKRKFVKCKRACLTMLDARRRRRKQQQRIQEAEKSTKK